MLAETIDVDPSAVHLIDTSTALRDALTGVGVPANWMNSKDDVEAAVAQQAEQQQQAASLEQMQQGADVANTIGEAKEKFA